MRKIHKSWNRLSNANVVGFNFGTLFETAIKSLKSLAKI